MSKSQYEKRRDKDIVKEVEEKIAEIRSAPEVTFTQTGFDIYTPDGGRTYKVAEISYNPETGDAKVNEIFTISRLVALSYANQKTALSTLKRKAIKA